MTGIRNLKLSKMASQVDFSTKNVPRFSFGLSVAPKLKKQEGPFLPPGQVALALILQNLFGYYNCNNRLHTAMLTINQSFALL